MGAVAADDDDAGVAQVDDVLVVAVADEYDHADETGAGVGDAGADADAELWP